MNTGGELGTEGAASARVAVRTVLHDARHPSKISLPVVSG